MLRLHSVSAETTDMRISAAESVERQSNHLTRAQTDTEPFPQLRMSHVLYIHMQPQVHSKLLKNKE